MAGKANTGKRCLYCMHSVCRQVNVPSRRLQRRHAHSVEMDRLFAASLLHLETTITDVWAAFIRLFDSFQHVPQVIDKHHHVLCKALHIVGHGILS